MGILHSILAVSVTVVLSLGGCRLVDSVFVAALCLYENVLSCRRRVVELSNLFEVALTYCCLTEPGYALLLCLLFCTPGFAIFFCDYSYANRWNRYFALEFLALHQMF